MTDRLDAFARRMSGDSFFLASAMQAYARSEALDAVGLARVLGCEPATLGPLGLCRRPPTDPPGFGEEVKRIADHFKLNEMALAEVVRRAEVLAALRRSDDVEALAAARDRLPGPAVDEVDEWYVATLPPHLLDGEDSQ